MMVRAMLLSLILFLAFSAFTVCAVVVENRTGSIGFGRDNKYNFYIERSGDEISVFFFDRVFTFNVSNNGQSGQ